MPSVDKKKFKGGFLPSSGMWPVVGGVGYSQRSHGFMVIVREVMVS